MSSEATVVSTLTIRKGKLTYVSQPSSFTADVAGTNGPTPGAVTAQLNYTVVNFDQLTAYGGLCRLMNLDDNNLVEWGLYDPSTGEFYGVGEILPGETYVFRLSRYLRSDVEGSTGTGTVSPVSKQFALKASAAPVVVLVEAFDP